MTLRHIKTIKLFAKLCLVFTLMTLVACDQGSGRRKKGKGREPAVMPAQGAKIAFIFPAGAGAMGASLAVTEKLESDLGIQNLAEIADVAGGVSSGSLMAAALTSGKVASKDLKKDLGGLVRSVFSDTNNLVDKLINDYKFTLDELEALFLEIMKSPPSLTSQSDAEAGLKDLLGKAMVQKISIKNKLGDLNTFITNIGTSLLDMVGKDTKNALALEAAIKKIIGDVPLSDSSANKFLAYATGNGKPVYFGPSAFAKYVDGPYAEGSTKLHEALISSSAIPHFIKAPTTINFKMPSGGVQNIPDLIDGFFSNKEFDPSGIYYDVFSKMFADEELLIVYVGNGAPRDLNFTSRMRSNYGINNDISQQTLSNGKRITFVWINTKIVDDKGNDLFNLSGFYDSPTLTGYMNDAGKKAVETPAYDWVVNAITATRR